MEKFSGAIQRILINGKSLQLLSGEHVNVVPHKKHVCASDQTCLNGGVCVPYLEDFICKCLPSFGGRNCQNYTETDGKSIHDLVILKWLPELRCILLLIESEENSIGIHFGGNMFLQYRPSRPMPFDSQVRYQSFS